MPAAVMIVVLRAARGPGGGGCGVFGGRWRLAKHHICIDEVRLGGSTGCFPARWLGGLWLRWLLLVTRAGAVRLAVQNHETARAYHGGGRSLLVHGAVNTAELPVHMIGFVVRHPRPHVRRVDFLNVYPFRDHSVTRFVIVDR